MLAGVRWCWRVLACVLLAGSELLTGTRANGLVSQRGPQGRRQTVGGFLLVKGPAC